MNNCFKLYLRAGLTIALISMLFTTSLTAAMRGRAVINNGNVQADNNQPLRAAPFFMSVWDVPDMRNNEQLYRNYFNTLKSTYNMNAVRVCPWIGNWEYDIKNSNHHKGEYLYMMDKVVQWAEEEGMYAIVNLHTQYGTLVTRSKYEDFWEIVAPRYKDKTHVIYEAINEPDTPTVIAEMTNIYQFIRNRAPNTHIILWSPNNPDQLTLSDVNQSGINYSNASIGFHVYGGVPHNSFGWDYADDFRKAGYPIICTEFYSLTNANYFPIDYDLLAGHIAFAEERGISWMSWAPRANYRATNASDSTHDAVKFSQRFKDELAEESVVYWNQNGSGGGVTVPEAGLNNRLYLVKCKWGEIPMSGVDSWQDVTMQNHVGGTSTQWIFEYVEDNIYRVRNITKNKYLHGDNTPGNTARTADLVTNWWSQMWVVEKLNDREFRLKCRWDGLFLTGSNEVDAATNMQYLNSSWWSQMWILEEY